MVELGLLLDEDRLRRRFGAPTLQRAMDYLDRGMVRELHSDVDADGDLELGGEVAGSGPASYQVFVNVGTDRGGVWVYSRCTCPVGEGCKHAVALMLAMLADERRTGDGEDRWERELATILDELDAGLGQPAEMIPLALEVDLRSATTRPGYRSRATAAGQPRGHLRLRPLQRGARQRWVRSGVGWQEVAYLGPGRGYRADQTTVLAELLAAHRAASRQTYFGGDAHLALGEFGPSLWPLLERVREAGVVLVPGAGLSSVEVMGPVSLQVDVNSGDGGAHVGLGVWSGDEWYAAADLDVLGAAGHGVALWRPGEQPGTWAVRLAPLTRPAGPQLRRLLTTGADLVVPEHGRDGLLLDFLPRLQRHLPVASSDGSVVLPEPAEPRLALTVTWVAADEVGIAWSWRYDVGGTDRVYGLSESRGLRSLRRPELEQALLDDLALTEDQVHRLCGSQRREHGLVPVQTFAGPTALAFAEEVLPGLEAGGQVEIEEIGARPDYREAVGAPVVRFVSREAGGAAGQEVPPGRQDWLDLEVVVSVDGHFIGLAQLLEALTMGQRRLVLRSGVHIALDRPEFAHLAELVEAAGELQDQPTDGVRVSRHDLGLWDELAELGIVDAQAAEWVRAAQALLGLETLPDVEPVGLKAELRHYQRDGLRWLAFLWESGLGGILADDMGLGKTLQTLALVAHARERGAGPFLVVAPTSVVSTWAHEAATFTPGLVVHAVTESHSRRGTAIESLHAGADLVVTSYTLFRLETDAYASLAWGGLVLDEAQTVKNHHSKTYQCVRRMDTPFRLALTGTPMENRLIELWSLLSIVAPGLYPYPARFTELVANPVEKEGDTAVLDRFRRRIRPFLLRRTKETVAADLPPKQEQVLDVLLTPKHRRIYETHLQRERQNVLGLVGDFDRNRIAIFRSLTKLRQLSLDAALIDPEHDAVGSAKIDVLVDHLLEVTAEGHRALVFSQFTSFLARVRARLDQEGLSSKYLDGRTRNRGEVVSGFRQGDANVFLISLKAGGVGLTLTEADYVFVLDPWWNPAVEAQAVDRAHRIGQQRPVMVYRLVSVGTIEEKVMALKARKAALFAQVLDGGGGTGTPIDAQDVRALFEDGLG